MEGQTAQWPDGQGIQPGFGSGAGQEVKKPQQMAAISGCWWPVLQSAEKMVIVCLVTMFLAMLLLMGTLYVHVLLFILLHIEHITAQLPADGVAHWPAALVYEGGSCHQQPAGGLHLLLGPLLPPSCPHNNLPHQPLLRLLHCPLQYLPGPHHV